MFISLTCEFSLNYSQILVQLLNFRFKIANVVRAKIETTKGFVTEPPKEQREA